MEWSLVDEAVSWLWEELRDTNKIALLATLAAVVSAITSWNSSRAAKASAEGARDQWREMRSSDLRIVGGKHTVNIVPSSMFHGQHWVDLNVRNVGMASAFDFRCAMQLHGYQTYWNKPVTDEVGPDETHELRIYFPEVEELHLPQHLRATVVFRDSTAHRIEIVAYAYIPGEDIRYQMPRLVILDATIDGHSHPDSPSQADLNQLQKQIGLEAILPIPDDVRVDTGQHNRFKWWRHTR